MANDPTEYDAATTAPDAVPLYEPRPTPICPEGFAQPLDHRCVICGRHFEGEGCRTKPD